MHEKIILFDGVCNLCNSSVQFVLKRDKRAQFHFGSLQGQFGQKFLQQNNLPAGKFNSFILIEDGELYTRSTGALRVLKYLDRGWPLLYALIIIPPFIRDNIYDWISANRYRWFGKRDECMIPNAELKNRFLD